jgi:hypothetical protein
MDNLSYKRSSSCGVEPSPGSACPPPSPHGRGCRIPFPLPGRGTRWGPYVLQVVGIRGRVIHFNPLVFLENKSFTWKCYFLSQDLLGDLTGGTKMLTWLCLREARVAFQSLRPNTE